ncbi:hypothetical protein G6M24_45450 [Agrobacterium tumefaciens]|nr:hypothetical protein [Agrobacterium tumefaciens]
MKTIKNTLIMFVALFSLVSCKKDEVVVQTTTQKIQVKWGIGTTINTENILPAAKTTSSYKGISTDYFDFRTDGKVHIKQGSDPEEVLAYTIDSDTQITIDGTVFSIQKLDDHNLTLYSKQLFKDGVSYTEDTFNLTK